MVEQSVAHEPDDDADDNTPWKPDRDPPMEPFPFPLDWPPRPEQPVPAPAPSAAFPGSPPAAERQRFADLTLYEGFLYTTADRGLGRKLADTESLLRAKRYSVEVAIRQTRTGIGADDTGASPVLNPRVSTEPVTIYVATSLIYGPLDVLTEFVGLSWDYDNDSSAAYIHLNPQRLDQRSAVAELEIRLYHVNLDLLDVLRLKLVVSTDPHVRTTPCSELRWLREPGANQPILRPDTLVRFINITIRQTGQDCHFTFIFERDSDHPYVSFRRMISQSDLELLLRRVRDFWARLAINIYADTITVTASTWRRLLSELRLLGNDAWTLLFGQREGGSQGSSEAAAALFESLSFSSNTKIQIGNDCNSGFIFPWALLYPPSSDDKTDIQLFWGARFQIEQVWEGRRAVLPVDLPIRVTLGIDSRFGRSAEQESLFARLQSDSNGRVSISNRVTDFDTLISALRNDPACHLYYFFCHGYEPTVTNTIQPDGVKIIASHIEAAPETTKLILATLLDRLGNMRNDAWLHLENGEITERALRSRTGFFRTRRPIVFMNMCQSAALLPSMNSGLVRLFIDRDASAVIGTEAPMTSLFAHDFSECFFNHFLSGNDVGTSLQQARMYFLNDTRRNPLGLAYTLYGRSSTTMDGRI